MPSDPPVTNNIMFQLSRAFRSSALAVAARSGSVRTLALREMKMTPSCFSTLANEAAKKAQRKKAKLLRLERLAKLPADQQPPRRPLSAYLLFAAQYRSENVDKLLDLPPKARMTYVANQWKNLSKENQQPFQQRYAKAKEEFDSAMEKIDTSALEPPRANVTGFAMFLSEHMKNSESTMKEAGAYWKTLDEATTQPYREAAAKENERRQVARDKWQAHFGEK